MRGLTYCPQCECVVLTYCPVCECGVRGSDLYIVCECGVRGSDLSIVSARQAVGEPSYQLGRGGLQGAGQAASRIVNCVPEHVAA